MEEGKFIQIDKEGSDVDRGMMMMDPEMTMLNINQSVNLGPNDESPRINSVLQIPKIREAANMSAVLMMDQLSMTE